LTRATRALAFFASAGVPIVSLAGVFVVLIPAHRAVLDLYSIKKDLAHADEL
jgi:hypothetical protein